MRIASLLPSATEIVCALGACDELVGRTHECDHPGVGRVPVLTRPRFSIDVSSRTIDERARAALADATSIYEIDMAKLEAAAPDVIASQDLSRMCRRDVRLVNLGPMRLADVWSDVQRTADAIGRREAGAALVGKLERAVADVSRAVREAGPPPSVLVIEWLDPVIAGGLWMPELVTLAGGAPVAATAGAYGRTLDRTDLAALDPDVVVIAPCGFPIERTLAEHDVIRDWLPKTWRAVERERVYVADGNAFNRPGPRFAESLELLASCIHPKAFTARNHLVRALAVR